MDVWCALVGGMSSSSSLELSLEEDDESLSYSGRMSLRLGARAARVGIFGSPPDEEVRVTSLMEVAFEADSGRRLVGSALDELGALGAAV
jgi:hypothetical protein